MPVGIQLLFAFLLGGLLGWLIGWLMMRGRNAPVVSTDTALVDELRGQARQHEDKQHGLQEELRALNQRNGELSGTLKTLGEQLTTERQQVETLHEKFRKEFEAVSNKLLVDNTTNFNRQSSENLETLLKPLKEKLGEFKTSLDRTHSATTENNALLKDQVSRIGAEAANLSRALKGDVKVLGNWGENMLDQILEKSGLQKEVHYRRQHSAKDVEGDRRFLDVIVDLPEKRSLVIDSKVSLKAYEESMNAADEKAKLVALQSHIESLRKHFKELGGKRYQDIHGINTPDFVLMYVPIEAAFFTAVSREPGLFGEALDYNVVIITNSTLLATLRTVSHVWQLANQQKHVQEIADRGGKLYDKFCGFVEDLHSVGKALDAAQDAWKEASKKLTEGPGNLVGQAQKLKTLGAKAQKALPSALIEKAVEELPNPDSAAESPPPN